MRASLIALILLQSTLQGMPPAHLRTAETPVRTIVLVFTPEPVL